MNEFLPKSTTFIKSDGASPVEVKIFPGSKEASGAPAAGSADEEKAIKQRLEEAQDLRKAAQKALVEAKDRTEKHAAEAMIAKADKSVQKAQDLRKAAQKALVE